ncbi:hypothetical protein T4B_11489, partial [Trichinella pseudospiralis]
MKCSSGEEITVSKTGASCLVKIKNHIVVFMANFDIRCFTLDSVINYGTISKYVSNLLKPNLNFCTFVNFQSIVTNSQFQFGSSVGS